MKQKKSVAYSRIHVGSYDLTCWGNKLHYTNKTEEPIHDTVKLFFSKIILRHTNCRSSSLPWSSSIVALQHGSNFGFFQDTSPWVFIPVNHSSILYSKFWLSLCTQSLNRILNYKILLLLLHSTFYSSSLFWIPFSCRSLPTFNFK